MSDNELQENLNLLASLNCKYHAQLEIVEAEIKNRYGYFPSEIDCDEWIDTYHIGCGRMSVDELHKAMMDHLPPDTDTKENYW